MRKVIEQVTGKTIQTITLVMVSHEDKDMSPKMTRGTSIAGSSTPILKAASNGNARLLQHCKSRAATQYREQKGKLLMNAHTNSPSLGLE